MKRVLVIVYYWPPSGGAGVQRWLKFVKYLCQFGWQPTVITTKNGDYPALDESLLQDVPENVKVIRTKTPTFGKLFTNSKDNKIPYGSLEVKPDDSLFKKLSFWIRLNFVIPDARKVWNRFALKAAIKELQSVRYNAVVTSGPPHSTHLIGLELKEKFGIKWLADFRDPWTKIDYLENVKRYPLTEKLDKKLEAEVIARSDLVLSINQKILDDLNAEKKGKIIPNGFDPVDFEGIQREESEKFEINYFGNITKERDPAIVLKAVNELSGKYSDIQVNIWGNVSNDVKMELNNIDTSKIIKFHSYIPHDEMLQKMVNSSLLLLLINDVPDNKGILTGKIYEYLGAQVPILGIGPRDGEAALILQKTKAGEMFGYSDQKEIADFISQHFSDKKKSRMTEKPNDVEKYSRVEQAKELANLLESI
jgi:glycosyltransferase involved in cell wall biosynthesis